MHRLFLTVLAFRDLSLPTSPGVAMQDGLPILEAAEVPYKSQNDGVMHACGHDGHMSGLLAAAKILFASRDAFAGVVKLIFQPAEEGYGGARVIRDPCLSLC